MNHLYQLNIQTAIIHITSERPKDWPEIISQSKTQHTNQALIKIQTPFKIENLPLLLDLINQHEIIPIGIQGAQDDLKATCQNLNLPYFEENAIQSEIISPTPSLKIHWGDIHSGQKKHFKKDIVIFGNIAKNSQITANGSIQIYGACYGKLFAGLKQKNTFVYVGKLHSQVIGIGSIYLKNTSIPKKALGQSAILLQKSNKIHLYPIQLK